MIFVTGPLFSGKRAYIQRSLGLTDQEFREKALWDIQDMAANVSDLEALADVLCKHEILIATETGGGVIPVDRAQREAREAAGRLSCILAARADTVIRVQCGLPQVLKGDMPCKSI